MFRCWTGPWAIQDKISDILYRIKPLFGSCRKCRGIIREHETATISNCVSCSKFRTSKIRVTTLAKIHPYSGINRSPLDQSVLEEDEDNDEGDEFGERFWGMNYEDVELFAKRFNIQREDEDNDGDLVIPTGDRVGGHGEAAVPSDPHHAQGSSDHPFDPPEDHYDEIDPHHNNGDDVIDS